MALPNLIDYLDLAAAGVDVSNRALADTMCSVASSLVREAAGSPVLATPATFTIWATEFSHWLGMSERVRPVTAVTAVTIDGVAASGWKLIDGDLWLGDSWCSGVPAQVVVTGTVGLAEVPAHIKQLAVDLAALGISTAGTGALDPRIITEAIDDYSVTFASGAEAVSSAMTIPEATRRALRRQFGGGVTTARMR
jgi:hypothetical protein